MEGGDFPTLQELVRAVSEAHDLDEALAVVAATLGRAGYDPVSCALSIVEPTGGFRIRGRWSAAPTRLEPGMSISPNFTADTKRLAAELLNANAVWFRLDEVDLGILSDLFRSEGGQAWILVPIMGKSGVIGVLSVGSADRGGFTEADVAMVAGVARGVERILLEKAPPSADAGNGA